MSNNLKCTLVSADGTTMRCDVIFESSVIIANIPEYIVNTHGVAVNSINVTAPTNVLQDADDENVDRFTFLFNGRSSYSDIEYAAYYDTISKEVFIINNPDYVDVVNMENSFINLFGYTVGSVDQTVSDGLSLTNRVSSVKLPAISGIPETVDLVQLNLHGIVTRFSFVESTKLSIDTSGYKHINLNTFIKIDKNVLFGTNSVLPLVTIHPSTMTKFNTKYIGKKHTDYIYIPIPV